MRRGPLYFCHGLLVLGIAGLAVTTACSDSTGPRHVETIGTHPDSAHLSPGESVSFTVRILDQRGDELGPEWKSRVEWSITNTAIATVDTTGGVVSVTALAQGTTSLRGEVGPSVRSIPIYVRPGWLDSIAVEPNPIIVSSSGRTDVIVRAFDAQGEEHPVAGLRVSWAVGDTTLLSVPISFGGTHQMRVRGQADLGPSSLRGTTWLLTIVNGLSVYTDVTIVAEPVGQQTPPIVTTLSDTSLEIEWDRYFGASGGYRLYRASAEDGTFEEIAAPGGDDPVWGQLETSHVDTGLTPTTTYWYKVGACNEHGCATVLSPAGSGTTAEAEPGAHGTRR